MKTCITVVENPTPYAFWKNPLELIIYLKNLNFYISLFKGDHWIRWGFSVPDLAEYVYQEEHKNYEYNGSCFLNGLPFEYGLLDGTQKVDSEMIKYKKDDRVLVQGRNAIYMYEEGKTQ